MPDLGISLVGITGKPWDGDPKGILARKGREVDHAKDS
jgi:hypothetical protein